MVCESYVNRLSKRGTGIMMYYVNPGGHGWVVAVWRLCKPGDMVACSRCRGHVNLSDEIFVDLCRIFLKFGGWSPSDAKS